VLRLHRTVLGSGRPEDSTLYLASFLTLAVALTLGSYRLLRRRLAMNALAFGSATVWLILAGIVAAYLPSGSYLFQWPLACALIALGAMVALDEAGLQRKRSTAVLWWLTAAVPIAITAPMIAFLYMGLGLNTISIPVLLGLLALTLWLFVPLLELLTGTAGWYAPSLAAVMWLLLLLAGALTVRYDRAHPRTNQIIYSLDADSREAKWASFDERPDAWSAQFLTVAARRQPLPALTPDRPSQLVLQDHAPLLELPPPELALTHDSVAGATRRLTLRLRLPGKDRMCLLYAAGPRVLFAQVNGRKLMSGVPESTAADSMWMLQYTNPAPGGAEIVLHVERGRPLRLRAVGVAHGLPVLGTRVTERPQSMTQRGIGDLSVVSRAFQF
jgi:hypothetical protein